MFCLPPLSLPEFTSEPSYAFCLLPLFLLSKISHQTCDVSNSPERLLMYARSMTLKTSMQLSEEVRAPMIQKRIDGCVCSWWF
jgi:hypothetical protein